MDENSKLETSAVPIGLTNAGKGRVKGVPNKVTRELREMILGALDGAGGELYLIEQAEKNPSAFMTLIGKVLPSEIKAEVGMTGDIVVKWQR